jgi:ribonuclease HI
VYGFKTEWLIENENLQALILHDCVHDMCTVHDWRSMPLLQNVGTAYFSNKTQCAYGSEIPELVDAPYYPDRFQAGTQMPRQLFKHDYGDYFKNTTNPKQVLIYTDGACPRNGGEGAKAGFAFVYKHDSRDLVEWNAPQGAYCMNGTFFARLEDQNYDNHRTMPTSNRAEIRAVIAAIAFLQGKAFTSRGILAHIDAPEATDFPSIVIGTDSSYVVEGITRHIRKWECNGWKNAKNEPVANKDLWQLLIHEMRSLVSNSKCTISMWHIPREHNSAADSAAKYAATLRQRTLWGVPYSTTVMLDKCQL